MNKPTRLCIALTACLLAAAPAAAQLYKWVDENGTTNYSNTPPPKTRTGKPATIVEETISVYSPEKSVTDELDRRAKQKSAPPPPPAAAAPPPTTTAVTPPPAPVSYDPCVAGAAGCQIIFDGPPVIYGRRRAPPPQLNQPQIPAGTIAGQANTQGSYIPGQSAAVPPRVPQASRSGQSASFTLKPNPRDPDPSRDSRR